MMGTLLVKGLNKSNIPIVNSTHIIRRYVGAKGLNLHSQSITRLAINYIAAVRQLQEHAGYRRC